MTSRPKLKRGGRQRTNLEIIVDAVQRKLIWHAGFSICTFGQADADIELDEELSGALVAYQGEIFLVDNRRTVISSMSFNRDTDGAILFIRATFEDRG